MQNLFYFLNDSSMFTFVWVFSTSSIIIGLTTISDFFFHRRKKDPKRSHSVTVVQIQLVIFILVLYGLALIWLFRNIGNVILFNHGVLSQLTLGGLVSSVVFLVSIVCLLGGVICRIGAGLEEMFLYLILGLIGPIFFTTPHLVSFFVGLEGVSFSFYILTGMNSALFSQHLGQKYSNPNRSVEAALRYLIPGLFSSLLIVLGLLLVYSHTPSLDIRWLLVVTQYDVMFMSDSIYVLELGVCLVVASFLFKFTIVPFHRWVFGVYSGVLLYVVFLISTVAKMLYFVGFVRCVWPLVELLQLAPLLALVGFLSIVVGTAHGLYEQRFAVVLACSGIINIGYAVVGLALGGPVGATLSLFGLFVYIGLLLGVAILVHQPVWRINARPSITNVSELGEGKLGETYIMFGLLLLIFALIGVPPLVGFFPKFFVFINLVLTYPLVVSWGFMVGVVVSAFIYFRWIIALLANTTRVVLASSAMVWSVRRTGLLIGVCLVFFGWGEFVDLGLTLAALCGGG